MACVAIVQATGIRCTRASVASSDRCKVHTNSLKRHGLYKTEINELVVGYDHDLKEIHSIIHSGISPDEYFDRLRDRMDQFNHDKAALELKHANS